ncbi:hypothetical protein JRQ81_007810 [Phrynocephalus forsythii]|uniref:Refilin A n=1 Tax=Phrynocephalus forsythii TaxID=171643 RepID=A0A9Q0XD65_9SAUR|nr:hypothetical protein JRQ81_007810 [Phrynocephalus forsythii]
MGEGERQQGGIERRKCSGFRKCACFVLVGTSWIFHREEAKYVCQEKQSSLGTKALEEEPADGKVYIPFSNISTFACTILSACCLAKGRLEASQVATGSGRPGGQETEPVPCATASVGLRARGGGIPSVPWPLPSPLPSVMVGYLQLQGMEESLKEKNREGLLDSPDSGLPPSPSPPFYSLAPGVVESRAGVTALLPRRSRDKGAGRTARRGNWCVLSGEERIPYVLLNASPPEIRPRMYPVFFGESIEVNPEPAQEIRCNSEVKYGSERHYRDDVFYCPMPTVTTYRETVIATPNCTWRNYKSQLIFEPRQKPLRFLSTTIIYPKHAKNLYRTTLNCSLGAAKRWFASSVQLQLCEENSPCIVYTENL